MGLPNPGELEPANRLHSAHNALKTPTWSPIPEDARAMLGAQPVLRAEMSGSRFRRVADRRLSHTCPGVAGLEHSPSGDGPKIRHSGACIFATYLVTWAAAEAAATPRYR